MIEYSKDGVSVTIVLDTRRALVDGGYPVKVRITYQRVQKYLSTGKALSLHDWEVLPTTKNKELSAIRKDIINSFDLVRDAVEELTYTGDFSFQRLFVKLRHASSIYVSDVCKDIISSFKSKGQIGTANIYSSVLYNLERYKSKVLLSSITPQWLEGWVDNMYTQQGLGTTTIAIRLRTLRAVLNYAIREGLIKQGDYPFGKGKFEIQEGAGRKLALTLEQIGRIARYESDDEYTIKYRDLWMFLYYCNGVNVADLIRLRYKDIVDGEVRFVRQKTSRTSRTKKDVVAVMNEPMKEIIKRWGNPPHPDSYIFPFLKGGETPEKVLQKTQTVTSGINKKMKKISKELGLPHISTYTARHSFATVLKRAGVNIAYISESLGHSDLKTTEHYLASFERDEREKNAALLTQF